MGKNKKPRSKKQTILTIGGYSNVGHECERSSRCQFEETPPPSPKKPQPRITMTPAVAVWMDQALQGRDPQTFPPKALWAWQKQQRLMQEGISGHICFADFEKSDASLLADL